MLDGTRTPRLVLRVLGWLIIGYCSVGTHTQLGNWRREKNAYGAVTEEAGDVRAIQSNPQNLDTILKTCFSIISPNYEQVPNFTYSFITAEREQRCSTYKCIYERLAEGDARLWKTNPTCCRNKKQTNPIKQQSEFPAPQLYPDRKMPGGGGWGGAGSGTRHKVPRTWRHVAATSIPPVQWSSLFYSTCC